MGIGLSEAGPVFSSPMSFMTDSDIFDILQAQALFPYRNRHPQGTAIIFKTVSGIPGGASWKLDSVKQNEDIREVGFVEKTGKRCKVG